MKRLKPKLLFVDDDVTFLNDLPHYLGDEFEYLLAENVESGLAKLAENPDLILLDIEMDSETDGIHSIPRFKDIDPDVPIVMLTRHSEYKLVVKSLKNGADDYFVKSPDINELRAFINKTLSVHQMKNEVAYLRKEITTSRGKLIGSSEVMKNLHEQIHTAASMDCPVLVTGETGTGKELVSRAIHEQSYRKDYQFVAVNISSINADLFASELFGHEKGAFTSALQRKKGLFETAGSGTILLDEIGDLPLNLQVKLLRVIEEKELMRVGGTQDIRISTRIITSTNQDLIKLTGEDRFRKDLFFRLNACQIVVPPLRDRKEDIKELAEYFIPGKRKGSSLITEEVLGLLSGYDWPGNVRQLKSVIEICSLNKNEISSEYLKKLLVPMEDGSSDSVTSFEKSYFYNEFKDSRDAIIAEFRKKYFEELIKETHGNITEVARISGMNRSHLYKILKEDGIDVP